MNLSNLNIIELDIKVLGTGCSNCINLEKNVVKVTNELNIQASVEKITDIQKILEYGIMSTPGLVVNGKVVMSGKVPNYDEVKDLITQNR